MKRYIFIGAVIIIACLGLCFGNLYCKNTLNPAFYTKESMTKFLEDGKFRERDDFIDEFPWDVLKEAEDQHNPECYRYIVSYILRGRMIYMAEYHTDSSSYFLMDLDAYLENCNLIYAGMLDVDSCPQGLSCQIYIKEKERTGDLEYFFFHYTNWKVPYIEEDSFFETSTGLFMGYRICKVCGIELYTVALACEDSKTGNRIFVVYTIPFEDNEDEILELRELGIPVITDFIK